jgi:hypothetical protein
MLKAEGHSKGFEIPGHRRTQKDTDSKSIRPQTTLNTQNWNGGRICANSFSACSACSAVLTPPGCRLAGGQISEKTGKWGGWAGQSCARDTRSCATGIHQRGNAKKRSLSDAFVAKLVPLDRGANPLGQGMLLDSED